MSETLADQLIDILQQAGVQRIYGVVGDSLNPIVDAARRADGIRWIHVRNEEAGAFAAAADAQLTGRLAVCAGSCGPGNTHLIQGLYDANRTGAPVLAIASQIPSGQVGTTYFQETHPERTFVDCSRFVETVSQAEQMPRLAQNAVVEACAGPGVAVLVIPGDVSQRSTAAPLSPTRIPRRAVEVPHDDQVAALAQAINDAGTVTIFGGAGTAGAHAEVMQLAERVNAPVGHTLRGKSFLQHDNPFDVGMSGLLGYGACYAASHEADLLLMLGTDFPYDDFLPGRNTVQVDRDAARLGRRTPLDLAVHGDVAATLRAVLPQVEPKSDRRFLDRMLHRHHKALTRSVDAYTHDIAQHRPIHPEYAAAQLDEAADPDAVFTVDTGMCNVWAARYLSATTGRRVIGSFLHGSMANALPHAIGAQLAYPNRQVISMSGDGGLGMLLGELLTLVKYSLPVKVIAFNNSALGMVKLEMMVDGYPDAETDNGSFDYAAIASAVGLHARRVEAPDQVGEAIRDALAHDGPALVDVVTDSDVLSVPPHITGEEVRGFALATGRTVLAGGVGAMIKLAEANLRDIPLPT